MKKSHLILGLLTLFLVSCGPNTPTKIDPAKVNVVKTQTAMAEDSQVVANVPPTATAKAKATATQRATAGPPDYIAPVISNVYSSVDTVYYEARDCGPTEVIIYAHVTDNSIAAVEVQYNFNGLGAGSESGWKSKKMDISQSGTSYYAVVLDAFSEGPVMGGKDGTLEYQVTAFDQAGNYSGEPAATSLSVSVIACQQQQAPSNGGNSNSGAPAGNNNNNAGAAPAGNNNNGGNNNAGAAPAGNNNAGAAPAANNNNGGGNAPATYPDPEFIVLNVSSDVVEPGSSVYIEWETINATCGVTMNGNTVNANGDYFYTIPTNAEKGSHTNTLVARGGDCNNPLVSTVTIPITITVPPTATPEPVVSSGFGYPKPGETVDLDKQGGADAEYAFPSRSSFGLYSLNGTGFSAWGNSIPSFDDCKNRMSGGGGSSANFSDGNTFYCFATSAGYVGYVQFHGFDVDMEINGGAADISYYAISSP